MTNSFWRSFTLGVVLTSLLAYVAVKLGWG